MEKHQKTIFFFNTHNALRKIASAIAGSFALVFLYKQGIPLAYLLFALAGVYSLRFLIRAAMFPILKKINLKTGMILGTWLYPLRFLALIPVKEINGWFFLFIFLYAASEAIYITCYHAYWASLSRNGHSGKSLGIREMIGYLTDIVSTVGSGYALAMFGPFSSFIVGAIVAAIASIPLIGLLPLAGIQHDNILPHHEPRKKIYKLLVAEGFQAAGWYFMWPLIIFQTAGTQFSSFGSLLGLAAFMQAIGWYFMGKKLDTIDKHWMAIIGGGSMLLVTIGRAFFGWSVPAIISLDAMAVIAIILYQPILSSTAYDIIKSSSSVILLSFWHEFGWESGAIASFLGTGLLVFFGFNIHMGLLIAGLGTIGVAWTLFHHHHPAFMSKIIVFRKEAFKKLEKEFYRKLPYRE